MFKILTVYSFVIISVLNFKTYDARQIYTSTVTVSKIITSLVPSSCVHIDATLPPCKTVRYLKLPNLPALSFHNTANEEIVSRIDPKIATTPLGWGEYFGFYAPTVTVTKTDYHITKVEDPSVVVTFAVKGCRPLQLPMAMDINMCPQESTSSILIEEILQTSTVSSLVIATETLLPTKTMSVGNNPSSTTYEQLFSFPEKQQNFQDNLNLLEPSVQEHAENSHSQPTEAL
ncbi:hypothetical protein BDFB_013403 [Asbolus verrucosus]|uniref:Uncharacterized protein n=1 Tax=Asbolus verrucosus TaxID=1661398 RepID=A0A482VYL2_ASBVE|nr:hypothetical protein BDFB_013403 [Asbolus verrucosus]